MYNIYIRWWVPNLRLKVGVAIQARTHESEAENLNILGEFGRYIFFDLDINATNSHIVHIQSFKQTWIA